MNNNITKRHRSKLRELVQLVLQKSSTKLSSEISEIVEGQSKKSNDCVKRKQCERSPEEFQLSE